MKRKKIVLIGTGKLSKAMVQGFLSSGEKREDILVIGRSQEKLEFFKALGVHCQIGCEEGFVTEFLILVITPKGAGPMLKQIASCGVLYQTVISFVSGLFPDQIARTLKIPYASMILATCNTNISCLKGIICTLPTCNQEGKNLLGKLGLVVEDNNMEDLTSSVVAVGSINAFDARALQLVYKTTHQKHTLYDWLRGLQYVLEEGITSQDVSHQVISKYLEEKAYALDRADFYQADECIHRARITLVSTIEALIYLGVDIDEKSIDAKIKTVTTEGGCTEKGIQKLGKIADIMNALYLHGVFVSVFDRAINFWVDVQNSFDE